MGSSADMAIGSTKWLSLWFLLRHTLVPLILACIFVVMVLPIREAVGLLWLALLVIGLRRYERSGQPRGALCAAALEVVVVVGIVAMAVAAPGKTKEEVLDRRVKLPQAEMTLTEIKELAEEKPWRESFPTYVSVRLEKGDAPKVIHFSSEEMNLREFVATIESQSSLRHRFHSCGNGYTILWGEDCFSGLSLRDRSK